MHPIFAQKAIKSKPILATQAVINKAKQLKEKKKEKLKARVWFMSNYFSVLEKFEDGES